MIYETAVDESLTDAGGRVTPVNPLPSGLTFLERATALLREYLRGQNLDDFVIFHAHCFDFEDFDQFLPQLDPRACWQPLPLLAEAQQPHALSTEAPCHLQPPGVVHLARHRFVLARWHVISLEYNARETLVLAAGPSHEAYAQVHQALIELRRQGGQPMWQIFRTASRQESRPRLVLDWSELLLPGEISQRLRAELINFFTPPVAELYRTLCVPYRRGVLMHGPPGNGKTSIIRALGWGLPQIPAFVLRPSNTFDDEDLQAVFRRWTEHAPAVLVIEDLDHILKTVNLSQFLNLIDGIEGTMTGGLLLVATTNHPEVLDPALNNRPGRFDVVIEIPCPDTTRRRAFFAKHLGELEESHREYLIDRSAGFSFSHLHEILRLSGLLALYEGGTARTPEHLKRAAEMVQETHQTALNGFPIGPATPFGLVQFRRRN